MSKISIIVPVYNVEQYLGHCLETLIHQTYEDLEIIVVDDGSPDNSAAVYQAYAEKDERIKIIRKENAGVSEARNTGLEHATGDYVMFVDSDDWMELNGCEALIKEAERTGADLVVSDVYAIVKGAKRTIQLFQKPFVSDDPARIRRYQMSCIGYGYNEDPVVHWNITGLGSPWNKLFKREIVQANHLRFDPYVKGIYDDNLFTLHYLNQCRKISYIKDRVYDYRIVTGSITQSFKENTLEINQRIFQRIQEFIVQCGPEYQAEFEKAFYIYVIRRLDKSLEVYFFADKNRKPLTEKVRELGSLIGTEPYATAIRKVDQSRLMKTHALTCAMARLRSPGGIWLWFQVKKGLKNLLHK